MHFDIELLRKKWPARILISWSKPNPPCLIIDRSP